MKEFSHDEQQLISKLKLLKGGDIGAHVRQDLKVRIMREIAAGEMEFGRRNIPAGFMFPRFARAAALAGILLFAAGTVSWAARGSMPDDLLYPVKIAQEDVVLWLTRDPAKKTDLHAGFVGERVREARAVANSAAGAQALEAALGRYEAQVEKVRKTAAVADREKVGAVAAKLSGAAAALLEEAENQLAKESEHASPRGISQKFVDAAQVSVAVLSEFVEDIEVEEEVDPTRSLE